MVQPDGFPNACARLMPSPPAMDAGVLQTSTATWTLLGFANFTVTVAPTFAPAAGTYSGDQSVVITAPAGAAIYYTVDGSTPTYPPTGTTALYATPVPVPIPGTPVAPPTFSPGSNSYSANQNITVTAPAGASIYFTTDGSTPTYPPTGTTTLYATPIPVVTPTVLVTIPLFSPNPGNYPNDQTVTIIGPAGANVYYTTDGSTPTFPMTGTTALYTAPIPVPPPTVPLAAPTFAPPAGTYSSAQTVVISGVAGATIYYSLDGSAVTVLPYTGPISITASQSLHAVQLLAGATSPVAAAAYNISLPLPVFSPVGGSYSSALSVSITAGAGAMVYYTLDGSVPTVASTSYTAPVTLVASKTVKAIQTKSGATSNVATAAYTIALAAPTFSPAAGSYSSAVSLSISAVAGASIYYTVDGSTPTVGSALYSAPLNLTLTQTVKAIQVLTGVVSSIGSAAYTIALAAPTFSPGAGPYSGVVALTIAGVSGASIYYTVDGSTPTTGSALYTSALSITISQTVQAIQVLSGTVSSVGSAAYTIATGGTASLVFNFPSFTSANLGTSAGQVRPYGNSTGLVGGAIQLMNATTFHGVGQVMCVNRQNITSFTTDFTFSIDNANCNGFCFVVHNSTALVNNGMYGDVGFGASGDANCMGYGAYTVNPAGTAIFNSIAVYFTGCSTYYYDLAAVPEGASFTGMWTEGGPLNPFQPMQDLLPYGINVASGHEIAVKIVYDGTILTAVTQDLTTGAQARFSWPVNLPPLLVGTGIGEGFPVGSGSSATAWVGFTTSCGQHQAPGSGVYLYNWDYYTSYNSRLATPIFSQPSGQYVSGQTITISSSSGATIYYTTNGLLPTSASTQYTGPLALTKNTCINAVAILAGYTDSYVAEVNYSIGTANAINFPTGFTANDGVVVCGVSALSGSQIELTNTGANVWALGGGLGAAWYGTPIPINGTWTTTFQLQWSSAVANGLGFIIQNQSNVGQSYNALTALSGGPNCLMLNNGGVFVASGSYTTVGAATGNIHPTGVMVYFDLAVTANSVQLYQGVPACANNGSGSLGTGFTFSGNTFNVTLSYNTSAQTLSISMTSVGGGSTFSHTWSGVNIPSIVGANTAYVGFAASCGFNTANQYINNWTMT